MKTVEEEVVVVTGGSCVSWGLRRLSTREQGVAGNVPLANQSHGQHLATAAKCLS